MTTPTQRCHAVAPDPPGCHKLALNAREAAATLGVSPRTLWSLTADQTSGIPHARIGRRVVYPRAALAAWLAARTEGGHDA